MWWVSSLAENRYNLPVALIHRLDEAPPASDWFVRIYPHVRPRVPVTLPGFGGLLRSGLAVPPEQFSQYRFQESQTQRSFRHCLKGGF